MSSDMEVLAPGEQTLDELAATINREHAAGQEHMASALDRWLCTGRALVQAREQWARSAREQRVGSWDEWVRANLDFSKSMAAFYMRVVQHEDVLRSSQDPVTGITWAYKIMAGHPPANKGGMPEFAPVALVERALELRREGLSYPKIATAMGVSSTTVQLWVKPEARHRYAQKSIENKRHKKQAEAALKEQERKQAEKAAARKAGGGIEKAYSLSSQIQDALGQAQREASPGEARRAVSKAGEHYRRMHDQIVRALGVS